MQIVSRKMIITGAAIACFVLVSTTQATTTFTYTQDFNSYNDYDVPSGWRTQDSIEPDVPPGVFSSDTSQWGAVAIIPPGGPVNYGVAWSGGKRFTLIHPVETPIGSFRAASVWYEGQNEQGYPLDLNSSSIKAEFDICMRTGTGCLDYPEPGDTTSADGMTFAIQPVTNPTVAAQLVGMQGGGLAWAGLDGFAIEFDLFGTETDPSDDANNHIGLDVKLLWNGEENINSFMTHLDAPISLPPGTLPDFKSVGDNNQPLHVTVFYNDSDEGGTGVVRVYLKVDPATKDSGESGVPISFGMEPGDSIFGRLVLEACVGPMPTSQAIFGFTAATGQCDAIFQVDNVNITADDEGGSMGDFCIVENLPVDKGQIIPLNPSAKVADCDDPTLSSPGWNVEMFMPVGYGIDALKTSIGLARFFGTGPISSVTGEWDLNYNDGFCGGEFAGTRRFPGIAPDSDEFGTLATAWMCFPQVGQYTLEIRSDDGFELVLGSGQDEQLISIFDGSRGCGDATRVTVQVDEPGVYPIRLLHFEWDTGAGLEFSRVKVTDTLLGFDEGWLIGKPGEGPADNPVVYGLLNGISAPNGAFFSESVVIPVSEKIDGTGTGANGFAVKTVTAPDGISIIESRDDDSSMTALRLLDAMQSRSGGAVVSTLNFRDLNEDLTPQPDGQIPGGIDFPGVTGENFATRAQGYATFPQAGTYYLWLDWDDHAWLKIGNKTVYAATSGGEKLIPVEISEAGTYPIRVEHVEFMADARVELGQFIDGVGVVALGGAGSTISVNVAATIGDFEWNPHGVVISSDRMVAEAGQGSETGWNTTLAKAIDIGAGGPPVIDKTAYGTMLVENNHVDLIPGVFPTSSTVSSTINLTDVGEAPAGRFADDTMISVFGSVVDPAGGNDNLGLSATGYIEFPEAGDYALNFHADDGAAMWIAGKMVTLYPFGSPPRDATPAIVHVDQAGLYDVRVDFFEHGGGMSFEVFQYLPDGTVALINDAAATVSVYRSLASAPVSTKYANPILIPGSAKAGNYGAGAAPGFLVETVNRTFVDGDGNRAVGGDPLRNLQQLSELLEAGLDGVPSLNQQAELVGSDVVDVVSFFGVDGFPGTPNEDDFGTRVSGYLELQAGGYLFEVDSDNGFSFWIGTDDPKMNGWNVGRSNELKGSIAVPFYFTVEEAGLYKFVFEHLERDGLESCYFSQLMFENAFLGAQLVNGDNNAVRAYTEVKQCNYPTSDADGDNDVDLADFAVFQSCYTGQPLELETGYCECFDRNGNGILDEEDLDVFAGCFAGPDQAPAAGCN